VHFPFEFLVRLGIRPIRPVAAMLLAACGIPKGTTSLAVAPQPVTVRLQPAVPRPGQVAELVVESPGSDSIVVESANGIDRFWGHGTRLRVPLSENFGLTNRQDPTAARYEGRLLDRLQRPMRIRTCRRGRCRELYHEVPLKLAERNRRTVALTAGWSSVFARRAITGGDRTVLFKEVLSSGVWSAQGELAVRGWNARVHGFLGTRESGGSLDLSRVLKRGGEVSYGVAVHLGLAHSDWLPRHPVLANRTVYRASVGPSIMLRGITASSQLGLATDGRETLQMVSTRISANGNLMSVRHPITLTAEKTFSFGGGPIVSRRREAAEQLTAGVQLLDDFALNIGVSSTRIAWPGEHPSDDLRGSETLITLGGQYSLTW
jgi:hypothetical protein